MRCRKRRVRRLQDATNALEIYNVASEHTDEYFVVWFPGPKVLLTDRSPCDRNGSAAPLPSWPAT